MGERLTIAFVDSTLPELHRAAGYVRGIKQALGNLGQHVVSIESASQWPSDVDVVIQLSDHGVAREPAMHRKVNAIAALWDINPAATLEQLQNRCELSTAAYAGRFDCVFTFSGGRAIARMYASFGVRTCVPINNAVDPAANFPVATDPRYWCDLVFVGDRYADRQRRVEEFLILVAECLPERLFLLGGNGWESLALPKNVLRLGYVPPPDRNAVNCSAAAVLNISREGGADTIAGTCTRILNAAAAGACVISDDVAGIEQYLEPGDEILIARNSEAVVAYIEGLRRTDTERIGTAARQRVLREHTFAHRAQLMLQVLRGAITQQHSRQPVRFR